MKTLKIETISGANMSDVMDLLNDAGKHQMAAVLNDIIDNMANSNDYGQFESFDRDGLASDIFMFLEDDLGDIETEDEGLIIVNKLIDDDLLSIVPNFFTLEFDLWSNNLTVEENIDKEIDSLVDEGDPEGILKPIEAQLASEKLTKMGNSSAPLIDKPVLDLFNIDHNTPLIITTDGISFNIRPLEGDEIETNARKFKQALVEGNKQHAKALKKLAES